MPIHGTQAQHDFLRWLSECPVNFQRRKDLVDGGVSYVFFNLPEKKEESINNQLQRARGRAPKKEYGGYDGQDPTKYGDWQHNGRCTDF